MARHRVSVEGVVALTPIPIRMRHDSGHHLEAREASCFDLFGCCPPTVVVVFCCLVNSPIATCTFCRSRPLTYVFLPPRTP